MALWLVRAGSRGEHEQKFLDDARVYVAWSGLDVDLSKLGGMDAMRETLQDVYPTSGVRRVINNASQICAVRRRDDAGRLARHPVKGKRGRSTSPRSSDRTSTIRRTRTSTTAR